MAMYIKDDKMYIFVADSDAVASNRIKNSTNSNSETTNYCPPENGEQKDVFYDFIGDLSLLETKPVILNSKKVKEYKKIMNTNIKRKYSGIFVDNMAKFDSLCDELISYGDKIIANYLYLTGQRPYLNFDWNEYGKKFKEICYGEATVIVVENKKDKFVVYPVFRPMFGKMKDFIDAINSSSNINAPISSSQTIMNPQKGGINKIYLGAPGCGKSRHIKDELKKVGVEDENVFRVTFHPEYANCDFIGQIMPEIKKGDTAEDDVVIYKFNPGPFSLALKRAYNTEDMVYLIVEEINRGNAAAIFGDTFQLLDRIDDKNDPYYCASEYPIKNPHMEEYLKANVLDDTILDKLDEEGIYIPSNLTIYATMNTSDQNVFTLDTAFKRRWSQEQIRNDIKSDNSHPYKNYYIPGTDVTWETFMLKVNDKILENKIQNSTNEDKRLGKYFISSNCLTENVKKIEDVKEIAYNFVYKVLEYIWNDVCKIGRDDWFDTSKYRTLEELIDAYVEEGLCLKVFDSIDFEDED